MSEVPWKTLPSVCDVATFHIIRQFLSLNILHLPDRPQSVVFTFQEASKAVMTDLIRMLDDCSMSEGFPEHLFLSEEV